MNTPAPDPTPRFPTVSRRAFLRRSALIGLAAAAAAPALASCSSPSTTPPTGSTTASSGGGLSGAAAPTTNTPTTPDNTTTPENAAATEAPRTTASGAAFASGSQLQVDFTYQAGGGGRIHSPYIAVWVENEAGDLVQTVSLWYKSDESKYLNDLKRWNSKGSRRALTTGATRIPGAFSVAWDGTDLDGRSVADGDYFVCVEAAREDGPYQIIRESVSISAALTPTTLAPKGELTAATVSLVA